MYSHYVCLDMVEHDSSTLECSNVSVGSLTRLSKDSARLTDFSNFRSFSQEFDLRNLIIKKWKYINSWYFRNVELVFANNTNKSIVQGWNIGWFKTSSKSGASHAHL